MLHSTTKCPQKASSNEQQTYQNIATLDEVKNETFVGIARLQSGKRISKHIRSLICPLVLRSSKICAFHSSLAYACHVPNTGVVRALPPRLIPGYTKESEGKSLWPSPKNHKFRGEKRWRHRPSEERVTLSPLSSLLFLSLSAASSGLNRRSLSSKSRPTWMLVPCTTRKVVSW